MIPPPAPAPQSGAMNIMVMRQQVQCDQLGMFITAAFGESLRSRREAQVVG